jgi:3'-phosphoadenosine 5'-phosphosulfate sulfotransferase (PAPS reductase)/FAD synthetase
MYDVAMNISYKAIIYADGNVLISWSGGKDSTFLLYLYCMIISGQGMDNYNKKPIEVVFADTTNESRGIYKFIDFYPEWLEKKFGVKLNLTTVRPMRNGKPTTMIEVVKDVGLPFINKEIARKVGHIRKVFKELGVTFDNVKNHLEPTMKNLHILEEMGFKKWALIGLLGWSYKTESFRTRYTISKQWLPMLREEAPLISDKCCNHLKKNPIKRIKFDGVQMVGTMAEESEPRMQQYLITGCNGGIDLYNKTGISKPLGAMTLQGLLFGIKHYDVPIAEDYGVVMQKGDCLTCSKAQRTGCALCGFGITRDWERFIRLQQTEANKINYAFKPLSQGGLGYLEICEYMNEYCGCHIVIPNQLHNIFGF